MTTINTPTGWDEKVKWSNLFDETKNEVSKTLASQGISNYRENRKKIIKEHILKSKKLIDLDDETKEKIIKAVDKIPTKIETDKDWSRLIEFKLWSKKYKILDPKLENHTDDEYLEYDDAIYNPLTNEKKTYVKLWWMLGDDIISWENEKLKKYVQQKQQEWMHIPSEKEMVELLYELGKLAELTETEDGGLLTFMYLTGTEWEYWLDAEYRERIRMVCWNNFRNFSNRSYENDSGNLLMISIE